MKRKLIVAILLALACGSSFGGRMYYGAGGESCGQWIAKRNAGNAHQHTQWMLGFVSAASLYEHKMLHETDVHAMNAWLDNYCALNPLERLTTAAQKLVSELRKR